MRINDILKKDKITISFEVFPPTTTAGFPAVTKAVEAISTLSPSFLGVTYGAGGNALAGGEYTANIAANIQNQYGITSLAHLTCYGTSKAMLPSKLRQFKEMGIENILALRGDRPDDGLIFEDYRFAAEMIAEIKEKGDFCIGGACYPEGHLDSLTRRDDINYLKNKIAVGSDFLMSQMCFDNDVFYHFLYQLRAADIHVPVLAGIMPITNRKQLTRSLRLSGANMPSKLMTMIDCYGDRPEAMKHAGMIYAAEQIIDLIANGVTHIHVYTMNRTQVAKGLMAILAPMLASNDEVAE